MSGRAHLLALGLTGRLLSTLAIDLPLLVVISLPRLHAHLPESPGVRGFVAGIALTTAASISG